ncbi:MAG: hypothetical protein JSW18_01985 [Candidatus Omnitrophota bacterium]|nr:MAG: hypothetical protein JSW18_01985 [Candidatus Omnitrophota bacterium]
MKYAYKVSKYLLGTYELELQDIVKRIVKNKFQLIINIGAGSGYYTVGLARSIPSTKIVAFETAEKSPLIFYNAHINHCQNQISFKGCCNIPTLQATMKECTSDSCIIIDAEGAEKELLNPSLVPPLRNCFILVELHDYVFRDIGRVIKSRFSESHNITEIIQRDRVLSDYPFRIPWIIQLVFKRYLVNLINERRPERMRWWYLVPKAYTPQSKENV